MTVLYNEIEPYCVEWLKNLSNGGQIATGHVDGRSIRDLQPEDVANVTQFHAFAGIGVWSYALRLAGVPDDFRIWSGSCPCPPFSTMGKRKGESDARHLWPEWFRLIRECQPQLLVGEQVQSPLALRWLDLVHADLEDAGYAVGALTLPAASVGAPHGRHRIFFGAVRMGDAQRTRLEGHPGHDHERGEPGRIGALPVGPASSTSDTRELANTAGGGEAAVQQPGRLRSAEPQGQEHSFWASANWLPCRDGKARPVEPGTFPLVDGAAFRVGSGSAFEGRSRTGMLRAYGNAIVPQVAAAFVRAFLDSVIAFGCVPHEAQVKLR